MTDIKVNPWEVKGVVDYTKLVKEFGTDLINQELIDKFEKIIGQPVHPWIRRGLFFSHRGLNNFLDAYSKGLPVYLYTGRGPTSNSMHLGHLIPFMFIKWLQDVFGCPLIIQISDDEKYYFKNATFDQIHKLGFENAKDIIACGFDPNKTFIFSNRDHRLSHASFEIFVSDMKKHISAKQVSKIFGFGEKLTINDVDHYIHANDVTVGMMDWPFYQSAPAFCQAFPEMFANANTYCLIACAIDQDPYFRMARDLADNMHLIKPCLILSKFLSPLSGVSGKMSSSVDIGTTLFLTDTEQVIKKKISRGFSGAGGNGSAHDHKKFGGNIKTDVSYEYLTYFEHDDIFLQNIKEKFSSGELSCKEMKDLLAEKIVTIFGEHRTRRELVTNDTLAKFYEIKIFM